LKELINNSPDPLLTAIRIAVAGNVIDMGVHKEFDIMKDIQKILIQDFAIFDYEAFKQQLIDSETVLYIGDNAGESVFDRLLIETIKKPVIFAVREIPIINDVIMEDAVASGLSEVAKIISSGSRAPGTILHQCTDVFLELFSNVDMIISKGQGNFESLSSVKRKIFFLLKAKCEVIADHLNVKEDSIILRCNNENNSTD